MALDMNKLNDFVGKFVQDFGASLHAGTVVIGESLGLYKALAEHPMTPAELAGKTHTDERYVREWLSAQAASGYAMYDPATQQFSLSEEQAFTLADENSPAYLPGAFLASLGALKSVPQLIDAFRTGAGYGWHQHDAWLFHGTEKFFRPGYAAHLVSEWIPSLDGVEAKLKAGATVADVGCGHGASTLLMAQAYPASRFVGYDYHGPSIEWASRAAERAGVADRVRFEVAAAKAYPGEDYDLVAVFDCLHDMGDPVGASRHVLDSLKPDGTWMIVEPFANDALQDNLNPVGRVFYSASTMICTPASRAQEVGLCLGAQAGEARMRKVVTEGGFRRFRRATETPFNLIYEARP
ncbi:Methyltransferase domain-containing protein [Dyella sp. OK004]|uniref:class I SAM-dependent methyltransferase n=1 Tax=Dyella sp. OK004 TaxID=1855292 RepID=UPI0008E44CFA|nr:class I SAM-dependent methyltransferase [Dyella sp. OK004]SFR88971.1 Methyltransferase domain-containing protein [Dyella sp. OK004]